MKLSIVTIGQSPREDFYEFFPENTTFEIEQIGVLDDYENSLPKITTDDILVSKLKNGVQVKMDKDFVVDEVKKIVDELNKGQADMILLACTGTFEEIPSSIPIVYPDKLVGNVMQSIFKNHKALGILVPDKIQKNHIKNKWDENGIETEIFELSPYQYDEKDFNNVCKKLNDSDVDYVVCDCMGYNPEFKNKLIEKTNKKVILSNEIVFNNIFSILS